MVDPPRSLPQMLDTSSDAPRFITLLPLPPVMARGVKPPIASLKPPTETMDPVRLKVCAEDDRDIDFGASTCVRFSSQLRVTWASMPAPSGTCQIGAE